MMSAESQAQSTHKSQERRGAGNEPDLCLLALDGGGVRGLSSLFILNSLMTKLNAEREKQGAKLVKPCQIFDMIGGTSTGGQVEFSRERERTKADITPTTV